MREVGFENDGDFTLERFDARYTADLADGLGNLASRVTAMMEKYRQGIVPEAATATTLDQAATALSAEFVAAMSANNLRGAAEVIERLVREGDGFVSASAPWALAKAGDDAGLDTVLAALARSLLRLALMCQPFMPEKAPRSGGLSVRKCRSMVSGSGPSSRRWLAGRSASRRISFPSSER